MRKDDRWVQYIHVPRHHTVVFLTFNSKTLNVLAKYKIIQHVTTFIKSTFRR